MGTVSCEWVRFTYGREILLGKKHLTNLKSWRPDHTVCFSQGRVPCHGSMVGKRRRRPRWAKPWAHDPRKGETEGVKRGRGKVASNLDFSAFGMLELLYPEATWSTNTLKHSRCGRVEIVGLLK